MECNKEEALRAKEIAQKKMESKDFPGARKFSLKAQQLYPEMENISQMICVCDVHCSAESKILGTELDWYGILQIEQTADDTLIKKQYRKFALLLHPDKNKFSGAEAAFKLIGEAQRVLLDKEKRSLHDMKRRTYCKPVKQNQPPQQASRNANVVKTSKVQNNFTNNSNSHAKASNATSQGSKQQAQSGIPNGRETFWTQCPYCGIRYQYYKEVLNRALRCQSCKQPFIAYDMLSQGSRPGADSTQPVFPGQNIPNMNASNPGSEAMKHTSNAGFQTGKNVQDSPAQKGRQSHKVNRQVEQGSKSSRKINNKGGKKHEVESSESLGSDSSLESEEVEINIDMKQQFDSDGDGCARRSSRNKRHVSYNEQVSDDEEIMNPLKKVKESGPANPVAEEKVDASEKKPKTDPSKDFYSASATFNESKRGTCNKSDGNETVIDSTKKSVEADDDYILTSSRETTPEPEFYEYPDPEFFDFDKQREEQCFKVGQVWAAYDTADAMPRFYAKIRKIQSPGFKLRITWLEANPDDPCGREWANSELPISCGKFKLGSSENTEDRLMFSHEVTWEKGGTKDSVLIYPKKGEIWALFKKWDAEWYLTSENDREFEYEFAEVLSEYDGTVGIRVAVLGKLKGFASLFFRKDESEILIPPSEVLKFSHRAPSYRMSGNEREGVPKDSFELDPASITLNLEEINLPKSNANTCYGNFSAKFEEVSTGLKQAPKASASYNNGKVNQVLHRNNLNGDVHTHDIPDSEFCNFDELKSVNKFQVNQVWALYSDTDGLPKYYGIIKKVDPHPHFKVQIVWLEPCHLPKDMTFWEESKMPITCGEFRLKAGKTQTYKDNSSFSHKVNADQTTKKNVLVIYPRKGEVWALYKNWNASMKAEDLKNFDYSIVEVLEVLEPFIRIVVLERVKQHHSVFRPRKKGDSAETILISRNELLRFSHQIPSFRLTDEKNGSLRGYWELDPAAFPAYLLCNL
ncbi:DnaJ-like protein subfamily B member 12 [Bienertia sinuspersici]